MLNLKKYNKIKIILYRVYCHGAGVFNLEFINENFTNIIYLDKNDIFLKIEKNNNDISSNLGKIDTNKNDISTNLINVNTNEDNIAYNLSEINYIKSNSSKSYLKNVYNILFYNKTTQIDFRNLFYEKYLMLTLIKMIL